VTGHVVAIAATVGASIAGASIAMSGCRWRGGSEPDRVVPELHVVVSERYQGGTRLVLVDERGDRWAILTADAGAGPVRDEQAAFSPDGRWLAFVSSRGRGIDRTSVWVMPAAPGATATRLTADGDDVDPTWTPDSSAIVFARRTEEWFHIVRVAIAIRDGHLAIGATEPLIAGVGHHLAPSVSSTGEVAYQEIDPTGRSRIGVRAIDGSITFVTDGPRDVTPAWRPDATSIAFARETRRDQARRDFDLWSVDRDGNARAIVELPGTDESGPRWSQSGRWLFATAIGRDLDGELPSVVYVDTATDGALPRMLRDRVGAIPRQGPAPAPLPLDDAALAHGPLYREAMADAWREREFAREQARAAQSVDAGI
jgi:Tol biopolymer transport system component